MGKVEHPIPAKPEMSTQAVSARLWECRRLLAAFEEQRPAAALASALREPGAAAALATLGQKIEAMRFEIDSSVNAEALASARDRSAIAEWMATIQRMPVDAIVAGINPANCCQMCGPEGCVITGGDPRSCGSCSHPVLQGGPHPQFRNHPQVKAVYAAACAKLNVRPRS
jgi:hypothetical protein